MVQRLNLSRRTFLGSPAVLALAMPTAARAQTQDPGKVTVAATAGLTGLVLQEVMMSQGFMKEQGLVPQFYNVSDGSKAVAALFGGSADFCAWSGPSSVTPAIEKGGKMKIIAGSLLSPTEAMFSAKPEIKKVADLVGKIIGVGAIGAQLHQTVVLLLQRKGIDPTSVTFRNVGSSIDVLKAVIAGTVDAGPSETEVYENQAKYGVHSLEDGDLWTELSDFTYQASYATDDAIAKRRPEIVGALAALAQTYRFIQGPDSQRAWIDAYAKVTGKADSADGALAVWHFNQKFKPYAGNLVLSPERIKSLQEFNVTFKVQSKVLPFDQVADMSLAQDALKRLG